MNWVGLTVGKFSIDALIGEGSFSCVYRGTSESGEKRAFKVAKNKEAIEKGMNTGVFCTKSIRFRTNGVFESIPDGENLLSIEYEKMAPLNTPSLPRYFSHVQRPGFSYLQLELLEGVTLFQQIEISAQNRSAIISDLQNAALSLQALKEAGLKAHGDLTPANIYIVGDGVKLIDPGHFGEITMADGKKQSALITTPQYYPLLNQDDLLALGLIGWQIIFGSPLVNGVFSGVDERKSETALAPETLDWINSLEIVGNFYISEFKRLRRPSIINSTFSGEKEIVLLKLLRLGLNSDGKIIRDPGFTSASELSSALSVLA